MFGIDVDCAEGGCLRQSASLQDDKAGELVLECANDLARNRRTTTAESEPQRGQVAASGIGLQQRDVHGRNPGEAGAPMMRQLVQNGSGVETGYQNQGAPEAYGG